jgi:adenylate kinase
MMNKNNEITKIPYSTYEGICPSGIILLVDEPENIYNRLKLRDNIKHDLSLLSSLQEQEIDYADYIKDKLNIPYIICNISEEEKIYTFIEDFLVS